jgi:hypothetical protein
VISWICSVDHKLWVALSHLCNYQHADLRGLQTALMLNFMLQP